MCDEELAELERADGVAFLNSLRGW